MAHRLGDLNPQRTSRQLLDLVDAFANTFVATSPELQPLDGALQTPT
jgi:hypothetical protein